MALYETPLEFAQVFEDLQAALLAEQSQFAPDIWQTAQSGKSKVVEFFGVDGREPVLGASYGEHRSFDMTFWPRTGRMKCTCARFKNGQNCEHLAALFQYLLNELPQHQASEQPQDLRLKSLQSQLQAKGAPLIRASEMVKEDPALPVLLQILSLADSQDLQSLRTKLYLSASHPLEDVVARALQRFNLFQIRDLLDSRLWEKLCLKVGLEYESPLYALQDLQLWARQGAAAAQAAQKTRQLDRAQSEIAQLRTLLDQSYSPMVDSNKSLAYRVDIESRRKAHIQVVQCDELGRIQKTLSYAEASKLVFKDFKYISDLDRKLLQALFDLQSLQSEPKVHWFAFFKLLRGTDLLRYEEHHLHIHAGFAWLDPLWTEDPEGLILGAELRHGELVIPLDSNWCLLGAGPYYVLDPVAGVFALDLEWPDHFAQLWNQKVRVKREGFEQLRPQIQQTALKGIRLSPSFEPPLVDLHCHGVVEVQLDSLMALLTLRPSLDYPPAGQIRFGQKGPCLFVREDGSMAALKRDEDREKELELEWQRALCDVGSEDLQREGSTGEFEVQKRIALELLPGLENRGWQIQGKESLQHMRVRPGKIRLNLASGSDFFDLQAAVDFGVESLSLGTLMKSHTQGSELILSDGSRGQLSEELWQRMEWLHGLAESRAGALRLKAWHLPLVQDLDTEGSLDPQAYGALVAPLKPIQVQVPKAFCGELRPYQRDGLDFMLGLCRAGLGGILADDMGLGKTVQILALILALYQENPEMEPALVVAPSSLLGNWSAESAKFAPSLRVHLWHGSRRNQNSLPPGPCLILTTYGTLQRDLHWLEQQSFGLAVLDESQMVKNPHTMSFRAVKRIRAPRRFCLTGTPVENHLIDLWAQMHFLNPGLLGKESFFSGKIARPVAMGDRGSLQRLRHLLAPFWLRRTKAEVVQDLPELTEVEIRVEMSPKQAKLYQRLLEEYRAHLLGLVQEQGMDGENRFQVLKALLRLRQVALSPVLAGYAGPSAKMDYLLAKLALDSEVGHKALVFSSFTQALDLLEVELRQQGLGYLRLDGSTPQSLRTQRVAEFQDPQGPKIFLISLKAGGVGLNLTEAEHVYLLDPWWNPAVEAQAAARAHRIGQKRSVVFYRLIAEHTVEDKILSLSHQKKLLAAEVLQKGEESVDLNEAFLRSLLEE